MKNRIPKSSEEAADWFKANYHWLKRWLECTVPSRAKSGQWFMRTGFTSHDDKSKGAWFGEDFHKMTLWYLVFGTARTQFVGPMKLRDISGFVEQTGRLPTGNSRVKIRQVECSEAFPELRENLEYDDRVDMKCVRLISRLEIIKK